MKTSLAVIGNEQTLQESSQNQYRKEEGGLQEGKGKLSEGISSLLLSQLA